MALLRACQLTCVGCQLPAATAISTVVPWPNLGQLPHLAIPLTSGGSLSTYVMVGNKAVMAGHVCYPGAGDWQIIGISECVACQGGLCACF